MRQTQVVAGSASKAAPAKVKVTQQADAEAAAEGGAVVGAVEGSKGSQNRGEGSGKGTKRPAEGEADEQAHAASTLRLAPNAKRQKTDAEWGRAMLVRSVWTYTAVYILFHISIGFASSIQSKLRNMDAVQDQISVYVQGCLMLESVTCLQFAPACQHVNMWLPC